MEIAAYQIPNLSLAVVEAPPPVGYRFHPTDFELLDYYLRRLIHGQPLPMLYPRIICADVYADHPSVIWNLRDAHDETGDGSELHCYFFTKLQSIGKSGNGKKMERKVGVHGNWHMSYTRNKDEAVQFLGFNKYFSYKPCRIHPGDVEYEWGMHEFTLHSHPNNALCKITRKKKKTKRIKLSNHHQPNVVDLSPTSAGTASSLSPEVEDSHDNFHYLEESKKRASKRTCVEGTECLEYDQHKDDDKEEAKGVRKYRRC